MQSERELAQGLKPLPDASKPVGNRTASGTMARDQRANSTSAGDFFAETQVRACLTLIIIFDIWEAVGEGEGCQRCSFWWECCCIHVGVRIGVGV